MTYEGQSFVFQTEKPKIRQVNDLYRVIAYSNSKYQE